MDVKKLELLHTDGNIYWFKHCGKQFGACLESENRVEGEMNSWSQQDF